MTAARSIPGFGGQVFAPGAAGYEEKRAQYAFSSYPEKQGAGGSMRPFLIAYPRPDGDDIPAVISFAKANNKRLVARSGGHQYSGMSSGGDDTVLLSMDLYNHLEIKAVGDKALARVGVGAWLTNVAAAFKQNGVTIPHGECPRVAIGGHVQSGGYGHLLRSYGLALDHVVEFKIYTSDGTLRTVRRPSAQDKSGLFWGVLGGGPGSFGILTEITFECIRDADHPYTWGYQGFFVYDKSLSRQRSPRPQISFSGVHARFVFAHHADNADIRQFEALLQQLQSRYQAEQREAAAARPACDRVHFAHRRAKRFVDDQRLCFAEFACDGGRVVGAKTPVACERLDDSRSRHPPLFPRACRGDRAATVSRSNTQYERP